MKTLTKLISVTILIIAFIACSDEPPSFRVKNEHTNKANVQIKTVANTYNINDVQPGTVTGYREVTKGLVQITAEIQNVTDEPEGSFNAEDNKNYTIVIRNTTPVSIIIDVSDK
jgi:hypothetical protein